MDHPEPSADIPDHHQRAGSTASDSVGSEALEKAEREIRLARQELELERAENARLRARAAQDAHTISSLEEVARRYARVEASVTWQLFQLTRSRLFGLLGGEHSRGAQAIQSGLRLVGRRLRLFRRLGRRRVAGQQRSPADAIRLPEFADPEVSIVIPVDARGELTRATLESIRDHTEYVSYEVVLVDGPGGLIPDSALKVHGVKSIGYDAAGGHADRLRVGTAAAQGRWLVLCHSGVTVEPGWLSALIDCALSNPDVAIVAPKLVYPEGVLAQAGGVIWRDGALTSYGHGEDPDGCHYEYRREIDAGWGPVLMIRADFWSEVGSFDERFRSVPQRGADLCLQARARGLRVMFEPACRVVLVGQAGRESGGQEQDEAARGALKEKWQERLQAEHMVEDHASLWTAANLRQLPHVLVADGRVPMWDRDSGALRMRAMLETLIELGCHVTLLPDTPKPVQPYTRELQRLGVEVLYKVDVPAELERIGGSLSLAILSRPPVADRWLHTIRTHAPRAQVVYDTVDLHWIREERRAAVLADGDTEAESSSQSTEVAAMRELELGLVRAADATLVVSDVERSRVLAEVPEAKVHVVPNVNQIRTSPPGFEGRQGVLFVGGFEHPPNVDAALMLVQDVMPRVWSELAEVRVAIVGADAPAAVEALASPLVEVRGWVANLDPVLDSARVLVAPLTYGAGLKGKVTQALAAGLPVVTTPIGAEGLDAVDGRQMLIGATADDLASRVIRVLTDPDLWNHLSEAGRNLAEERCSQAVMTARLSDLIAGTAARTGSARG